MKVAKSTQLYIKTPNKVGELQKVLAMIRKAGVSGLAYAGYAQKGKGHIMLVTANNAKASRVLKKAGYKVRKEDVVLVTDKNVRGSGARVLQKIADAKINLKGAYATAAGKQYLTVLQATNISGLVKALKK